MGRDYSVIHYIAGSQKYVCDKFGFTRPTEEKKTSPQSANERTDDKCSRMRSNKKPLILEIPIFNSITLSQEL